MLLLFGFDTPYIAILTLLSALLHEAGHIFIIWVLNGEKSKICPTSYGFRIDTTFSSYREEAMCAFGGPLVNILLFLLFFAISPLFSDKEYLLTFALVNLLSAISNLLPIQSYDGHKILHSLLAERWDLGVSDRVCYPLSFLLSATLTLLSLYLLLKCGEGYWIFGIFFTLLFTNITELHRKTKSEKN